MQPSDAVALSPKARVDGMAARLSALGFTSVVRHGEGRIQVEAHVPQSLSHELWQELFAVLKTADCFGLVDSSTDGRSVWAGVNDKTPATVHAVRGHGHQP